MHELNINGAEISMVTYLQDNVQDDEPTKTVAGSASPAGVDKNKIVAKEKVRVDVCHLATIYECHFFSHFRLHTCMLLFPLEGRN